MSKTFKDKRLPRGITIYLNDFNEYVASVGERVAQIENNGRYENVRASRTLEGAIQYYLNKKISQHGEPVI
ncbi:MAG: hypothetical protein PHY56_00120 [Candidatus Omnitrophica bacterium]|nr:hypothetical protein [Candidatus Omnitrophota bacterium]